MAITKPPVLPAWAESGDRVTPSNAEIQVGWPLSSIPPSRQRFNWLLNFLANGTRYFSRRGLPDYDAAETYMTGDRIIGDDGKTYRSLIDTNIAQTPSTSPTKWERWALTLAEMYTSLVTPAQFDNTVKPATTAFVQRAVGNYSGVTAAVNAMTLTAANSGTMVNGGTGVTTITLPTATSFPAGGSFVFSNTGSAACVLSRQGTDLIVPNSATVTSISVAPGDAAIFVSVGDTLWYVFLISGIGLSQTWQNVVGSRAINTGYTNTTGKPIMVSVALTSTGGGNSTGQMTVGGIVVYGGSTTAATLVSAMTAIVPPGATYTVSYTGAALSLLGWSELR